MADVDGPLLARLPWAEAMEVEDQLVVLTESRALLLADLTATVWLHLDRPCSVEELVRAAEEATGAPGRRGDRPGGRDHVGQQGLVACGSLA